ncbi:MAG TPA: hypothetical protein VFE45_06515 [Coriobacteriia bacterium]|nr:hypothetical protein [Coriobacteriia bacterium]
MTAEQVRENRARRAAERRGLRLHKSRRRDPNAVGYGRFWLTDQRTNTVVAGDDRWNALGIDEIERHVGIVAD